MQNCDPRDGVNFDPRGIILTTVVEDLKMMLYTKYESSWPWHLRRADFWKLHFENLFFDPVTYLCNQSESFDQFMYGTTQGPILSSVVKFPLAVQEKKSFELFLI